MFGSMFIGLSGMQAYSNGLRQISNNITNLNSSGFKATDLSFADVFGRQGAGDDGLGYGVTLSDSRLDFDQGELRQTERDLDLAIEGDGFLVLLRDSEQYFARTGSFEVDADGFIVLAGTDYRLTVLGEDGNPTAISIDSHRTNPPQQTTRIQFADNLSSSATEFSLSNIAVFDALGASDNWQVKFERDATAPAGEWTVIVSDGDGTEIDRKTLRFINGIVDPATAQLTFEDTGAGRSAILDFSTGVTSFSSGTVSTLRAADVDGYGTGEITAVRVNEDGVLEIAYSNEQTHALGDIALAEFRNPQMLEQRGGGLFVNSQNADVEFLTSEHVSTGQVLSRRAESSNVDLSQQFGDLILIQRGYQASSQVVSVSNDMIQQLFGIRGQG